LAIRSLIDAAFNCEVFEFDVVCRTGEKNWFVDAGFDAWIKGDHGSSALSDNVHATLQIDLIFHQIGLGIQYHRATTGLLHISNALSQVDYSRAVDGQRTGIAACAAVVLPCAAVATA